jgi:hypothetical protein
MNSTCRVIRTERPSRYWPVILEWMFTTASTVDLQSSSSPLIHVVLASFHLIPCVRYETKSLNFIIINIAGNIMYLILAVGQSVEIQLRYLKTKGTGGELNYLNCILLLLQRKSVRVSRIDAYI